MNLRPLTTLIAAVVAVSGAESPIPTANVPNSPLDAANTRSLTPPPSDCTPHVADAHVGPDWKNRLAAWIRRHSYYPPQAVMNHEEGDVTVQVTANPSGQVTSVEMQKASASEWLNIATRAMFRNASLPPLPDTTEPITFDFTMRYRMTPTACPDESGK